ncbi:hypothetical protein M433DRAFT_149517 [Acidomyces richmondensis BFW]|nr:MAG: hypothetical protein FE78DRAFT_90228 [Acidomyces sp. 'richmondensis']KYG49858.1 hypothetical protein M433DRAFT_149517 [Acidomyces richmondensis BFW]
MVIIRESPSKNPSAAPTAAPSWPPRSPFHALLSSPGGRQKWRDRCAADANAIFTNTSGLSPPSPSRKQQQPKQPKYPSEGIAVDEEEEEEEWRLEEIALRRRQMAFQRKRRETGSLGGSEEEAEEEEVQLRLEEIGIRRRRRERERERLRKAPPYSSVRIMRAEESIEVPLSPPPPAKEKEPDPVSPARRRLGLTSAPQAARVSLKRARDGNSLRVPRIGEVSRPKSFGERLREGMREAEEKEERLERKERARSGGFHRIEKEEEAKGLAVRRSAGSQEGETLQRSASVRSSTSVEQHLQTKARGLFNRSGSRSCEANNSDGELSISPPSQHQSVHHLQTKEHHETTSSDEPSASPSYDPFSRTHLSKRQLSHPVVARHLQGKTVYTLPDLLKDVRAPHYDPPDLDNDSGGDFVLFAILASKSSPHDQKPNHHIHGGERAEGVQGDKKFMVLKLCDLKWDIDLFLFGPAFTRFWKLTPGTLLAILNPGILPPKAGAPAGAPFCLKLASSEDTILEIGVARDLAFCSATRKDGRPCEAWVDKRRTEVCGFHLDLFVERQRKGRMEVNTMSRTHKRPNPPVTRGEPCRGGGGSFSSYAVPPSSSAARLLDLEDRHVVSTCRETEASRQRLAAAQKERELRRALEQLPGNNPGKDYLSLRAQSVQSEAGCAGDMPVAGADLRKLSAAEALGLRGRKRAEDVRLSPAKERKAHFGLGRLGMGKEAMGWGGGTRKVPLARAAEVEAAGLAGRERGRSVSPVKKKARFVLEGKGIREPGGRESGGVVVADHCSSGVELGQEEEEEEDDDDGLEIV